jgi:hypothetical protein
MRTMALLGAPRISDLTRSLVSGNPDPNSFQGDNHA